MSLYAFATNPGARIEPDAGEKVSGFVPSTPAAAKKLNDILYELTTFALDYKAKFAVEHDPADGSHTDITGQTMILSGQAQAATGKITGNLIANSFVFGDGSGVATDEALAVHSLITQQFALANNASSGTIVELTKVGNHKIPAIKLEQNQGCVIPFYVPGNTDLSMFDITLSQAAGTMDTDWELMEFDWSTGEWGSVTGGPVTGTIAGAAPGRAIANLDFPDTNTPNVAGHGVRIGLSAEPNIPGEKFMGLKLINNSVDDFYCYKFSYLYYVSNVEKAVQR